MRVFTVLVALGLVSTSLAAPIAQPEPFSPILFAKDPLSIHRRSTIPETPDVEIGGETEAESEAEAVAPIEVEVESQVTEPSSSTVSDAEAEEPCAAICGIQRVEGARSEREALCSVTGLHATLECAQCIDSTWPETTWEDSAMAEYERIVSACDDSPQTAFRRSD